MRTSSVRSPLRRCLVALGLGALILADAGCAAPQPLPERDRLVIAQLAEIAPRDADILGETSGVECWKPSESLLDDTTFRVICRVHYDQAGAERYRDMICVGDVSRQPVTDHCYPWAYYTDTPAFEDKHGYRAVGQTE